MSDKFINIQIKFCTNAFRKDVSLFQVTSSVLMGIDASRRRRCVTGSTTVRTDLMKWTVQSRARAAIGAATTTHAVYLRASCVTVRETAQMGPMRKSVVRFNMH